MSGRGRYPQIVQRTGLEPLFSARIDRVELPEWLDDEVPLLDPAAAPRIMTRRRAHKNGYTDRVIARHIETRRWSRLLPGVYLTQPPPMPTDRLYAAALRGGPGAVLSGGAALYGHGLRAVGRPRYELVLVAAGSGVRSFGRVRVRHTARLPAPCLQPGPPLAPVERAVADHARSLLDIDDVRTVVAEAVQRGFCDVDSIAEELRAGRRNGSSLLRCAVGEVSDGAASAPEAPAGALLRAGASAAVRTERPGCSRVQVLLRGLPMARAVGDPRDRQSRVPLRVARLAGNLVPATPRWRRPVTRSSTSCRQIWGVDADGFVGRVRRRLASRQVR